MAGLFIIFVALNIFYLMLMEKGVHPLELLIIALIDFVIGCSIYNFSQCKPMVKAFLLYCFILSIVATIIRRLRRKTNKRTIATTYILTFIFTYLIYVSEAYFFHTDYDLMQQFSKSGLTSCVPSFIKYLPKSFHFAFQTMTEGTLMDDLSLSNTIIDDFSNSSVKQTPLFFLTELVIGVAPFSTVTWLLSLILVDFSTYLKMIISILPFQKTILVLSPNKRSLCVAKIIRASNKRRLINGWNVVFCRCNNTIEAYASDIMSGIDEIGGIAFNGTELDYHSPSDRTYYLICAKDYDELYGYVSVLNKNEDKFKNKIVIHDGFRKDIEIILKTEKFNDDIDDYKRYSTWEEMLRTEIDTFNDSDVVLVAGKGRIKDSFLLLLRNTASPQTDLKNKGVQECDLIIFPSSIEEHSELMKNKNKKILIRNPEEYVNSSLEDDIYKYIENYYPKKKKIVYLLSEDIEENIRIKHLLYEWLKNDISHESRNGIIDDSSNNLKIVFKIYCNNETIRSIEKAWDKDNHLQYLFSYIGEEQALLEKICMKILE